MRKLRRFLDGNPAMGDIFDNALRNHNLGKPITPAERIVLNETLTRVKTRLNEIEIEEEQKLESQVVVPESLEKHQLQSEIRDLKQLLRS